MRWAVLLVLVVSCNNPEFRCLKSLGELENAIVETADFNTIVLNDNIDLVLQSGPLMIAVEAGANLHPFIDFDVADSQLTISNSNTCNWIRKYKKPQVTITHPNLEKLELLGFGHVRSEGTFFIQKLRITALDSPSDVDLEIEGSELQISSNNVSNFKLKGRVGAAYIGHFYNDGIIDARALMLEHLFVDHRGMNSMHFSVQSHVEGTLSGNGNLFLYSDTDRVEVVTTGAGKVLFR